VFEKRQYSFPIAHAVTQMPPLPRCEMQLIRSETKERHNLLEIDNSLEMLTTNNRNLIPANRRWIAGNYLILPLFL
jgi:hypothetical protein